MACIYIIKRIFLRRSRINSTMIEHHTIPFPKMYLLLLVALLDQLIVVHAQVLTGFTLIRPPDISLGSVPRTINLADVGTSLNIKAETSGEDDIAKVVFWFDGLEESTELVEPYALGGIHSRYIPPLLRCPLLVHILSWRKRTIFRTNPSERNHLR